MSQENVELFRTYIEEIRIRASASMSERDKEDLLTKMAEFWDPKIENDMSEVPLPDIEKKVYRGKEEVRQWWKKWLEPWTSLRFDYELLDAEDRVVMLLDLWLRDRSMGIEVHYGEHAWVNTFRDGLILHSKFYESQSEARKAVGLSEQDAHAES
jgi:hypothetical protein